MHIDTLIFVSMALNKQKQQVQQLQQQVLTKDREFHATIHKSKHQQEKTSPLESNNLHIEIYKKRMMELKAQHERELHKLHQDIAELRGQ